MGTENYKLADSFEDTEKLPFNEMPTNLVVDRKQAYLKKIKEKLSFTKCRDAKVEYYLSRWKIN